MFVNTTFNTAPFLSQVFFYLVYMICFRSSRISWNIYNLWRILVICRM